MIGSKDSTFYTRRERKRLGKFIVSFFAVVRFVINVDEETEERRKERRNKERERNWGKSLFQSFSSACARRIRRRRYGESVCVRNTTNGTYPKGMNKNSYCDYLLYERCFHLYVIRMTEKDKNFYSDNISVE